MPCNSCGSDLQSKFPAEIAIHFPGPRGLDKPHVLLFPTLVVCLNCGHTDLSVPEQELHKLQEGLTPQSATSSELQSDGSHRSMKAAANLEAAKALVKDLAASSPGEYVISKLTGEKTSIKLPAKQKMFQIGYDEKLLNARAELFRRCGYEVISVHGNEAAKHALTSIDNVDVFVVGYAASEKTRKEMIDWLKENFPRVKIVALVSSVGGRQLPRADYNVVWNDPEELLSLLAAG